MMPIFFVRQIKVKTKVRFKFISRVDSFLSHQHFEIVNDTGLHNYCFKRRFKRNLFKDKLNKSDLKIKAKVLLKEFSRGVGI